MSEQRQEPGQPAVARAAGATVPRDRVYELLAHLVASAEICVVEPHYYGSFRLIDAAAKLAATMLDCGLGDPWLADLAAELDRSKVLMMSDRPAFYAYLPQASREVAERLRQEGGDHARDMAP
jgi:hypothetical protein